MKHSLICCSLLITVLLANAQYTWVNKNQFPDSGFFQAGAFVINGFGYLVGGQINNNYSLSNHTWQYNPVSDTWIQKASYPRKISLGASFVIGGVAYQVGGFDTTFLYASDNNAYNPITDTWTPRAAYPEQGVGGGYYFVINGIAYVGSGVRNSNDHGVASGYAYNPATDSWTPIADFPNPAIGLCSFAIDSFGYAGAGGDGNGNFFNSMFKYNPATNTWTSIAPFPGKARFVNNSSFVVNHKGYVGAGETISSNGGAYCLGDYYSYNPATDTWTAEPGVPGPPRHAANAFSFGDSAYLIGGYNQDGALYYRYVSEFKPTGGVCSFTDTTYITVNDTAHITLTDTAHISVTDTLYVTVSVGISPNAQQVTLSVYPNPAHTRLNINTGNYSAMSNYSLKLVNTLGQTMFSSADNQPIFSINISGWATGVYYLQVISPASTVLQTKEIVIQ